MSTLDASPQTRLRLLAASLRLHETEADDALVASHGDVVKAETILRRGGIRRPARELTQEERIRKSAIGVASTPDAVDILRASLAKVLAQPLNEKLRKINVNAGPFKERVSSKAPSAVELLYAVGYQPMHGYLVLQNHQPGLLKLALEALDAARAAPSYVTGRAKIDGEKAQQAARVHDAEAAAARRAAHLAKVPAEPKADGATSACVITVRAPGGAPATRRFESDNTLEDLVNWILSLECVPETEEVGALTIENVTVRPARRLELSRDGQASLYALDLWPRGQVEVRASA